MPDFAMFHLTLVAKLLLVVRWLIGEDVEHPDRLPSSPIILYGPEHTLDRSPRGVRSPGVMSHFGVESPSP
jgi:hypothetical protein